MVWIKKLPVWKMPNGTLMDGNDMSYNTWVQQCQQTEGFGRVTVKDRMWISDIVCQVYLFPSDWNRTQEVPQTVSPPLMLPFHPNWLASFGLVSLQVQRPLNFNVLDNMIDKFWQDVICCVLLEIKHEEVMEDLGTFEMNWYSLFTIW